MRRRGLRSQRAHRKPAFQRRARLENIVDQDHQRAAFAAIAADISAARRFGLGVAAVKQPVAVAGLSAAFAFNRGIAGVLHSNLKIREGGYPLNLLAGQRAPQKKSGDETLATFFAKINRSKGEFTFFLSGDDGVR
jgi:hypothetical protein